MPESRGAGARSRRQACGASAVVSALALLFAGSAGAQPPAPGSAAPGLTRSSGAPRKQARAVRIANRPPRLDGRLDDPAWRLAVWVDDFLQKEPVEGAPPREKTEVGFLYDGEALYVGARMYSARPQDIPLLISRRDQPGNTERIIVSLDPYHDRRTAHNFAVSIAGVRSDYYQPRDSEYDRDPTFDPVWEARTAVDSLGWTAEMRIPFSQLRFNDRPVQVWGLDLNRWIPARNEDVFWVYVPRQETGWASHFGDLVGIEGIRSSRRLELLPYAAGNATLSGDHDSGNPFDDGRNLGQRLGADLKMGLGPNLTLDAAANPDFGQVEADPADVNLSGFETYFDEKRPFFIEGNQLLSGGGPSYFYSRRIGAAPPAEMAGDFVDMPKTCTILGAAKVTGRLASGLALGALGALTGSEHARAYEAATGRYSRAQVAPRAGYGVVRLQQEFGPAQSTAGLSLTAVRRDVRAGEPLAALVDRQAYAGGGDWNLRFKGGEYELGGYAGFSWVEGDSSAILRLQRSSAHYFQRPDAGYLHYDPRRTSLGGYTASLRAERLSGAHWLGRVNGSVESPGFELNDAGRLSAADDIDAGAVLLYRDTRPGRVFREYAATAKLYSGWNFGGARQYAELGLELEETWRNFVRSAIEYGRGTPAQSDNMTRGGPSMGTPGSWWLDARVESNYAATTGWGLYADAARGGLGGYSASLEGRVSVRPGARWQLSVEPRYQHSINKRQYVTTRDTGGRPETFGGRYIFSYIERSTLSTQLRLSYALSPDLTLEGYAEPFAASGRYWEFGELLAPRSRDLRFYGTDGTTIARNADGSYTITDGTETFTLDNPDFDRLSFRSNLVLRWEWRPGSTLFAVWQQDRGAGLPRGERVGPRDLWDSLRAGGDTYLALKLSYWLPVR